MSQGNDFARFTAVSLALHGTIVAAMAFFLAHDSPHVEGTAGLTGNPQTHFDVTMEAVTTPSPVKALPVAAGLPVTVKNETMEIDTPPPPPIPGQGGTGNEVAEKIGDSERTNRLGLYLQKMQRKIQANLGPAGYLAFPTKAKLVLDLRKDGNVTKITVTESSGDAALDRLAIRAVQKSLPFDPWDQDQPVQLPVVFR